MFKYESAEDEIFATMQKSLQNSEKNIKINKLAKVVSHLNDAIAIFKNAGLKTEANKVQEILDLIISGE